MRWRTPQLHTWGELQGFILFSWLNLIYIHRISALKRWSSGGAPFVLHLKKLSPRRVRRGNQLLPLWCCRRSWSVLLYWCLYSDAFCELLCVHLGHSPVFSSLRASSGSRLHSSNDGEKYFKTLHFICASQQTMRKVCLLTLSLVKRQLWSDLPSAASELHLYSGRALEHKLVRLPVRHCCYWSACLPLTPHLICARDSVLWKRQIHEARVVAALQKLFNIRKDNVKWIEVQSKCGWYIP